MPTPKPIESDDRVVRLAGCPDCDGRGWFLINPFATGGGNGAGGLANMTQCQTCLSAEAFFRANNRLPAALFARLTPDFQEKYREFATAPASCKQGDRHAV